MERIENLYVARVWDDGCSECMIHLTEEAARVWCDEIAKGWVDTLLSDVDEAQSAAASVEWEIRQVDEEAAGVVAILDGETIHVYQPGDTDELSDADVWERTGSDDEIYSGTVERTRDAVTPPCEPDEDGEPHCHDWQPGDFGCRDNSGVEGIGGGAVRCVEVCRRCGLMHETVSGDCNTPSRDGERYYR